MENNKLRVVQDYDKLSVELKEQVKLVYPEGYSQYLIQFVNSKGKKKSALRFETDEKIYMLRMSEKMAYQIMEDDDDYDEEHNLINEVRDVLQTKHADVEYLVENEYYDGY